MLAFLGFARVACMEATKGCKVLKLKKQNTLKLPNLITTKIPYHCIYIMYSVVVFYLEII